MFGHCLSKTRRAVAYLLVFGASLALATTAAHAAPLMANNGTILSLTAVGASDPGDPIQISSSVQADSKIQRSNLYYELFDPAGTLLATRKIDANRLAAGDIVNDSWSYSDPPETGDYTVTLCWSTGNAENCHIASAQTSFYSVPTMGLGLSVLAALLLAGFLLRNRRQLGLEVV